MTTSPCIYVLVLMGNKQHRHTHHSYTLMEHTHTHYDTLTRALSQALTNMLTAYEKSLKLSFHEEGARWIEWWTVSYLFGRNLHGLTKAFKDIRPRFNDWRIASYKFKENLRLFTNVFKKISTKWTAKWSNIFGFYKCLRSYRKIFK